MEEDDSKRPSIDDIIFFQKSKKNLSSKIIRLEQNVRKLIFFHFKKISVLQKLSHLHHNMDAIK